MSRRRLLTAEERRLWAEVARAVRPLPGRAQAGEDPTASGAAPPPRPSEPAGAPVAATRPAGPPPLAPLERRTLRALSRGQRRAEATIDLHGMRQTEAHATLIGFLRQSQARGRSLVLVVTGKGSPGGGDPLWEGRGVLRRLVPLWLRLPDLRGLVLGFEEAAPHHGGSGALYVRLRRRRAP